MVLWKSLSVRRQRALWSYAHPTSPPLELPPLSLLKRWLSVERDFIGDKEMLELKPRAAAASEGPLFISTSFFLSRKEGKLFDSVLYWTPIEGDVSLKYKDICAEQKGGGLRIVSSGLETCKIYILSSFVCLSDRLYCTDETERHITALYNYFSAFYWNHCNVS